MWPIQMVILLSWNGTIKEIFYHKVIARWHFEINFTSLGELKNKLNFKLIQNFRSTTASHKRQITQVSDCGLKRLGNLDFDMFAGGCFASNDVMVLCFGDGNNKQCRSGSNPTGQFTTIQQSEFDHFRTRMSASEGSCVFNNKLIFCYRIRICIGFSVLPWAARATWTFIVDMGNPKFILPRFKYIWFCDFVLWWKFLCLWRFHLS